MSGHVSRLWSMNETADANFVLMLQCEIVIIHGASGNKQHASAKNSFCLTQFKFSDCRLNILLPSDLCSGSLKGAVVLLSDTQTSWDGEREREIEREWDRGISFSAPVSKWGPVGGRGPSRHPRLRGVHRFHTRDAVNLRASQNRRRQLNTGRICWEYRNSTQRCLPRAGGRGGGGLFITH